jgi:hypothetical protein
VHETCRENEHENRMNKNERFKRNNVGIASNRRVE